jgi:adenosylmethionine-8-amino-7-oxononanoate aminotransferase
MEISIADLASIDRQHLIHSLHHPSDLADAVIFVSGSGANIKDVDGNEYIDGLAGLWNVNIGHGRAEMAEVAAAQMKKLAYFSGYAGSSTIPSIELAQRLVELAPHMQAAFFTSGGAEANESAFKTARFYWKALGKPEKLKVISRVHAYHGVTLQSMSATGIGSYWKMFEPRVPGFIHIETCYPYRAAATNGTETVGQAAARGLEEAILREGPDTVAAFVGEPIHGAGGVIYPSEDYWPRIREVCTKYDVLLIADEIITGFGRTGRWFGMEHWNVKADMISFGKGVTSGYLPLGGIMMTQPIKDAIESVEPSNKWMHGYTYSGHPACCVVALKNIAIIEREGLLAESARKGNLLHDALIATFGDHPNVGDIRSGKGLLVAVEFVEDRATKKNFSGDRAIGNQLRAEMKNRGLVTRTRPATGAHPGAGDQVLLAPPLVITDAEVERMVEIVRESVEAVLGR